MNQHRPARWALIVCGSSSMIQCLFLYRQALDRSARAAAAITAGGVTGETAAIALTSVSARRRV